ncbi:Arylsulfatase A or related enzyme [Halalkaliarchaeum sp. AArc-CO]|uniref:sulfatase-like hydrolase/transferase n=1 Tax=Halalkaliarchaeum sp. AArc-CO TaxID=2866381 RepID=UPI00217E4788|nr:sulfatase-like hydrolase/transferase [Halalkaliarchaeum sp. AArc-CO]UWG52001.1 Arylsulfatase A or related enzyme [Halalkaliarchaeum sp. AArc-CO]
MNDVFLITVDALRRDHFNKTYFSECWNSGFNDFVHFQNCYSNGVATPLSFPSIHTGYPVEAKGELKTDVPTIAELYDDYTFAITNNPHLRPDRGYDRGFDSFTRKPGGSSSLSIYKQIKQVAGKSDILTKVHNLFWETVRDSMSTQPDLSPSSSRTAENILGQLESSIQSQPGFFWVHLMEPHHPYYPQKVTDRDIVTQYDSEQIKHINNKIRGPAIRSMGLDKTGKDLPSPTEEEIEFCREMYGEIVKYIDRNIAKFFKEIQQSGRWEQSMIILLADHGEAFGENGVFQHDWSANPIDSLIEVPLAVKYPNNKYAGENHTHAVQTGDLLATLSGVFDWNVNLPRHTRPFIESGYRPIISKSNNALRVTTDNGYAIQRDDSIVETNGEIADEALTVLRSASLPSVESMSGDIPGLTGREQDELEDRLKHLGYK